ncbi:hypothetical protein [Methanobrevibacter smithii]|uniref:hypothetical protein n=1 Tax=Methanobrevibacter smithii TaxID=2173 RepID=UPI001C013BC7|nr:hypothetical protein [Methanobrevibacter smithii]MBT9658001.1 hypothetical protein [Methanobrevibacter smithii]
MKIKGYNIKNPETVNQTTIKRILESNLNKEQTYKFKHSEYFKEVTIYQNNKQIYKIYDMNFNQYYYICSYLESVLNIKQVTEPETIYTNTTITEEPEEYKTTIKEDIICIINTILIIVIIITITYIIT